MKKLVLFFTAVLLVTFLSSCKEDSTTSPDPEQGTGFPLAAGNWWKYDTYEVDVNGNPLGDLKTTYTTTLGSKITLDGREAYEMMSSDDGEDEEKSYISVDNNGVYSYNSPEVDDNGNVTPGLWVKIVDFKNSSWDIASEPINEEEEGYKQTGTITLKGVRQGTTNVTYKGKSYSATTYLNIITTDLTTEILVDEEWEVDKTMRSDTTNYVFIGGIGFYSSVDFNLFGILGSSREKDILIDHKVK